MSIDLQICPICQKPSQGRSFGPLDISFQFECDSCGEFKISAEALARIDPGQIDLYKVSACLKERKIRGQPTVTIVKSREGVEHVKGAVVIDDILEAFPRSFSERTDRILLNLSRLSNFFGHSISLNPNTSFPIFFAKHEGESRSTREYLSKTMGFIEIESITAGAIILKLTGHGWKRIEEIEREKTGKESIQTFVAMSFDEHLNSIYENGIKKAIEAAGYNPRRIDLEEHNEKICDQIIAEIRKSRFLVADFTEHKAGVYFEAGYAVGLGIPVIWLCHKDQIGTTHFDTRQYNHILWEDENDLYEKLLRRIEATIS